MKNLLIFFLGLVLGVGIPGFFDISENEPTEEYEKNDKEYFESGANEGCDPKLEKNFYEERLNCNQKKIKAEKFWTDIENEVKKLLIEKDVLSLSKFMSCDAFDLTWYELHCESDRLKLEQGHISFLIKFLEGLNLHNAKFQRSKPDLRVLRNPRWKNQSRLKVSGFKLSNPWLDELHPTENETVVLLEEKLDGRIYLVGIPVTGVE